MKTNDNNKLDHAETAINLDEIPATLARWIDHEEEPSISQTPRKTQKKPAKPAETVANQQIKPAQNPLAPRVPSQPQHSTAAQKVGTVVLNCPR